MRRTRAAAPVRPDLQQAMGKYGKGCCASLAIPEEEDVRVHCCASFIVKHPCSCCWLTLLLAIFSSVVGWAGMLRVNKDETAGPLRGPDDGLTYPFKKPIPSQMDALKLAVDEAEATFGDGGLSYSGRRLKEELPVPERWTPRPWEVRPAKEATAFEKLTGKLGGSLLAKLPASAGGSGNFEALLRSYVNGTVPNSRGSKGRKLQSGVGVQTDSLFTAFFIFKARSETGNVFDDAALAEQCAMHHSLTRDATRSGPYQGYPDFCRLGSDGNCHTGLSPLAFFYGDASYDIESLDPDVNPVWNDANLERIVLLAASTNVSHVTQVLPCIRAAVGTRCHAHVPPCTRAAMHDRLARAAGVHAMHVYMPCTCTCHARPPRTCRLARAVSHVPQVYGSSGANVLATLGKLYSYYVHWLNAPVMSRPDIGCDPAMKKDTAKVLRVVAAIRGNFVLNQILGGMINFYFDKEFSSNNLKSRYTRSTYSYGAPLKYGSPPFLNADDRTKDQEDLFVTWFYNDAKLQDSYDEHNPQLWATVEPTGFLPPLLLSMLVDLLVKDGLMALAPLVVVFLIVWLQTRSLFIAILTVTECILSFTASVMIMFYMGIQWMAFEQFLGIYIVLAIGADDVFVFMDAYKQSFYMGPKVNKDLVTRMSWVYRRAGLAMLITSLTTACAFVTTAMSAPIPTLQLFGIFAACVILFDYLLVMTFLCAGVVIYHNYFETKPGLCCACCQCGPPDSTCDWWLCGATKNGGCSNLCSCAAKPTTTDIGREGGPATIPVAKPLYVRFFEDIFPFGLFIEKKSSSIGCIAFFFLLLGPCIYGVSQLEPQTSAEQLLPESHPFQRFFTVQNAFVSSQEDESVEMQIVYGFDPTDPIDHSGVNRLINPKDWGTPKYSSSFIFDAAAQQAMVDDCAALRASSIVKALYQSSTQTTTKAVFCWPEAFKAYRECKGLSFPVPRDAGEEVYKWVTGYAWTDCPAAAYPYSRPSELLPSYRFDFTGDLGWVRDGLSGVKLAWARVRVDSMIKENANMPATELRVLYSEWEALIATLNAAAPASLGLAMQIASKGTTPQDNKWLHMVLQETYVNMALNGVAIGLLIAFLVLLVATQNIIIALLSISTIGCALCSVIATIVGRGWQLGQAESLSMMILTGFAVDYIVHLSHAYMESKRVLPLHRVHDACRDLGISVFWGMLTSLVAAYVLSMLQLQFFSKFGSFFFLTILWAYLWSVLFLLPLLALIGPRGTGPSAISHDGVTHNVKPMTEQA